MASESPSRNDRERRDAFDKAGYWPNQIMWKAWCQSWTASRRAALTDAAVECEALGRMAPNNERGFAYDIAAKVIRELIAAPQEGAVSPAGPAANGEPAAAASVVLSEMKPNKIVCPFCNPVNVYADPAKTRAEQAERHNTRKRCPNCPYSNGCMVEDCDE